MRANRTMPRLLKKRDGFLLLLILIPALVSAGLFWNQNTAGSRAVIRINGEIVSVLPLSAEGSYPFENNGIHLTVTLQCLSSDGSTIFTVSSDGSVWSCWE